MFYFLASLMLLFTAADHWTTYLCLRAPVDGWVVTEANPLAEWLFNSMGLVPGLLFDSVVTIFAIAPLGFPQELEPAPHRAAEDRGL